MPFYEYECSACKHHTEVLQKISDAPLKKCPECGKQALKRLISAPVFRLKGGGWYETDFKSDSETKRNLVGKEEAEATKSDTKVDDKKSAEAKPAEVKPADVKTPAPKASPAAKPAKPAKTKSAKRASKKAARR